ncbi:hypothetical protein ACJRO7_017198 [Eucalyptus globulus]|uniref:Uncharacterized protein n=1 Tax=Eucalyptus globulus TaxID=34317 RepID=A0ABD3KTS2_EUCGL
MATSDGFPPDQQRSYCCFLERMNLQESDLAEVVGAWQRPPEAAHPEEHRALRGVRREGALPSPGGCGGVLGESACQDRCFTGTKTGIGSIYSC